MIPAEAVEAAMRAWGVTGEDQRKIVRTILEAAAPHMLAAAWEEGMQAMYDTTSSEWPPIPDQNPYRPTA